MLEIEEVMPLYVEVDNENSYVTNPYYARHQEMVKLFDEFNKHFYTYVDDRGRLVCVERRTK